MRRAVAEAVVTIGLSVGIAVAVFAAGTGAIQTPHQSAPRRVPLDPDPEAALENPASSRSSVPTGPDDAAWGAPGPTIQATGGVPSGRVAGQCRGGSVIDQATSRIRGSASLCSEPDGLRAALEVDNLAVGEVYTLWLAYFDRASACRGPRCTLDDALGDDPVGVLGRLDGAIATGPRGRFAGQVRDLRPSLGSQASLLLVGHGHANTSDRRLRARQLLTLQSPRLGAPLAGAAADGEAGSLVAYAAYEFRADP